MLLLALMFLLCILGFPVALSMMLSAGIVLFNGNLQSLTIIPTKMTGSLNNFSFMAIPLFMLAGELMNSSRITDLIFDFAQKMIGRVKGGLAYVNTLASMLFAGMSGSALADASGLGKILIQTMRERGYPSAFSAALTGAGACLGPVIPPSTMMVIAALATDQSVGRLLLGGAGPGVLMGLGIMGVSYILSFFHDFPSSKWEGWLALWHSFLKAFPPLMTPVILIGGIFSGMFTPTEASVVTCIYAIALGFYMKSFNLKRVYRVFCEVGVTAGAICLIVSAAQVVSLLTVQEMIPQMITEVMLEFTHDPNLFMIICIFTWLVLGCFIGDMTILVVMGPILMPMVLDFGIDPVHFVVLMVLVTQFGMITPPMGVVMFICNEWAETNIVQFAIAVLPFIIMLIIISIIMIFVPEIVTWFPNFVFR